MSKKQESAARLALGAIRSIAELYVGHNYFSLETRERTIVKELEAVGHLRVGKATGLITKGMANFFST